MNRFKRGTSGLLGLAGAESIGLLKSNGVALGSWETAYKKASDFVESLTPAQKLSLVTGSSVNTTDGSFDALTFLDGEMGLQNYFYVSAFGQANAIAMTWDEEAIYAQAKAVGSEFYNKGVQVLSGPTSQPLGRTPWGGRGVEGFGPDPYLNGLVTGLSTKGYADAGVIPGAKHFLLYEQETNRTGSGGGGGPGGSPPGMSTGSTASSAASASRTPQPSGGASSGGPPSGGGATEPGSSSDSSAPYTLTPTTKRFMKPTSGPSTMLSGTAWAPSCHLKTELGFPGLVWPDANAQDSATLSALNGEDYGSSSIWSNSTIETLLSNGTLTQARFNDMAIRNVIGYFHVGLDNGKQPSAQDQDAYVDVRANHSKLIRQNGAKSLALLKNNGGLPLDKPRVMSVFGAHAGAITGGPNTAMDINGSGPTYQGHLATGTGSAQSSYPYLITPHIALTNRAVEDGTMLRWILNDTYASSGGSSLIPESTDSTAVSPSYENYASGSDVCLVFLNALSGEGADRTELYNTDQDAMVNTVAENCNNTIVVLNTVGPRLIDQWIEHDNVTAVLYGSLLGQESGNSIADVLYGDVNPSGRLIYSLAKNESDYNVDLCYTSQCSYTEGVYLDYRYFDANNITVRYPFGHGLSYTSFSYSNLNVNNPSPLSKYPTGAHSVGGNSDLWDTVGKVLVTVHNTGSVDGAEVPQLYLGFPEAAGQPVRQLRGFKRVDIKAGGSKKVNFSLRRRDLSYWDVKAQKWAVAQGQYKVFVGASSRDLKLNTRFTVRDKPIL
ncbi:hypothetical protein N8T08_001948 [Aspergillus melleus]|uniref:Uncharacterized protein n=1 Tax=Aspergillus melleus TaxID=138277 RepID=A0ACC3B998_9EURO|nr:hypothetical protein N8T08_001948 [Aspergillus melleus]